MVRKLLLGLFIISISVCAKAAAIFQPLPMNQAFTLSAYVEKDHLFVQWSIAHDYYLYKDRINFTINNKSINNLITFPPGLAKSDEILGKYEVYDSIVTVAISLAEFNTKPFNVLVSYQGCAKSGFCYPPAQKQLIVKANNVVEINNSVIVTGQPISDISHASTSQDKVAQLLAGKNWFFILLGFLSFGLLLAFTPCVMPLIPILSGIIVGQGSLLTPRKAFILSAFYVLAMAIAYAIAGVIAGLAGSYVQAFMQSTWVITLFSFVFVLLALSLFGYYEIQLPSKWQEKINQFSGKQSGGSYIGVAAMGALSTLIISPCVTPPLVGALTYIGQTGDAILGGSALFMMGIGFGIPLLIIGTAGGKLLPQAGAWTNRVKHIFGILMLSVAIWLMERVFPLLSMLLWAILVIGVAVSMNIFTEQPVTERQRVKKAFSIAFFVYGIVLIISAAAGGKDAIRPFAPFQTAAIVQPESEKIFKQIKNIQDLDKVLVQSKTQGRPVLLDFYADWCVACKQMQRNVFSEPKVQQALKGFVFLRANVTTNDNVDQALEDKFDVIAPPSIIFFDKTGKELKSKRIIGEMNADDFLNYLQKNHLIDVKDKIVT